MKNNEKPTLKSVSIQLVKRWFPLESIGFWLAVLVVFALFVSLFVPPSDSNKLVLLVVGIFAWGEIAWWRYHAWRPENTKAFNLGVRSMITFVHKEGMVNYNMDGEEFVMYSNRANPKGNEPDEQHST